ncbi:MAG: hypothetical protein IJ433_07910 [Ruminococcus sp.]|nr:hypothetical protein [Ruminococcus sp.]
MCDNNKRNKKFRLSIFEMTLFAMFSSMMFISKIVLEFLPNIHLLGMFTMLLTVGYRKKALIPIYIYVLLNGVYAGFNMWWVPYLYVWTVLWGVTMLLPTGMSKTAKMIVYPVVCALHGLYFGVLFAPTQALMFNFTFEQTIAWIVAGFPFDIIHAVGNFVLGFLIYPLSTLLIKLSKKTNSL